MKVMNLLLMKRTFFAQKQASTKKNLRTLPVPLKKTAINQKKPQNHVNLAARLVHKALDACNNLPLRTQSTTLVVATAPVMKISLQLKKPIQDFTRLNSIWQY
jgi:hypothetical protein